LIATDPRPASDCCTDVPTLGAESNEELSHIHLDSDAVVVAVEDTAKPATPGATAAGAKGDGVAVVLAFRCARSLLNTHRCCGVCCVSLCQLWLPPNSSLLCNAGVAWPAARGTEPLELADFQSDFDGKVM
jgi:hypothetical protein